MDIQLTAVAKIIEGAIEGNILKVTSYAEHIAKQLDIEGEHRGARIIRKRLDGSYKNESIVTLDNNSN